VLEIARPYLGTLVGQRTDWTPSGASPKPTVEGAAEDWQFAHFTRF
jgi:homospermidine synthase